MRKPVVVIDRLLADRYWPGQDPIGKRIDRGGDAPNYRVVIGVVAPIKFQSLEENLKKETLYYPIAQLPATNLILVVKTGAIRRSWPPPCAKPCDRPIRSSPSLM